MLHFYGIKKSGICQSYCFQQKWESTNCTLKSIKHRYNLLCTAHIQQKRTHAQEVCRKALAGLSNTLEDFALQGSSRELSLFSVFVLLIAMIAAYKYI